MLRLTLRTLLAWLDGVLPAEEAGAFAEKLGSSGSAKVLADRIRAVVAHPGLDAPKVLGRGLAADANSVAEYLTNSLPADSVAAFERVCIESDAHLAEVASCHRLLVEARNDPRIFEPPEADELDRLLAATRDPSRPQPSHAPSASLPPRSRHDPAPQPLPSGEARKTSSAAWASVVVALLLVSLLAGTLAWRLWPKALRGSAPSHPDAVAVREPPPDEPPPPASETGEAPLEAQPEVPETKPAAQEPAAVTADPPATEPATPSAKPVPVVQPEASRPAESPPAGRVPGGDALAIAAKPPRAAASDPVVAPPQPAEPEAPV